MIGCLGRRTAKRDRRNLRLASFVTAEAPLLPGQPFARYWSRKQLADGTLGPTFRFEVFDNDRIGDCTCAALGHYDETISDHTGVATSVTTPIVREAYAAISGWRASDPRTDVGATCLDALKEFRRRGMLAAFVELDEGNRRHLEAAINMFGAAYVGADLPAAAQRQEVWDTAPANRWDESYSRNSWGGHAMIAVDYDALGVTFVTWGRLQRATWSWVFSYVAEAYGPLHRAIVADENTMGPSGYLARQILEAAERISA